MDTHFHVRSAPAGVSLDFLLTSCTIRLPVDPACSQSLAGPFFPGLYLLSLWLLSRGLVCIGADSLITFLCSGRAMGGTWSSWAACPLYLSLSAPRCAPLAQIFCSPSVSRHIARWQAPLAKVAPQSASEPGASLRLPTNLGSLFVVLFSPVFSDSTVVSRSRCAS